MFALHENSGAPYLDVDQLIGASGHVRAVAIDVPYLPVTITRAHRATPRRLSL